MSSRQRSKASVLFFLASASGLTFTQTSGCAKGSSMSLDAGATDARVDTGSTAIDATVSDTGTDARTDTGTRPDAGEDAGTNTCATPVSECTARCEIDIANPTECGGPFTTVKTIANGGATLSAAATGASAAIVRARICNPNQWVLHIAADARDEGRGGRDSEAYVVGTNFGVGRKPTGSEVSGAELRFEQTLNASGCAEYVIRIEPRRVRMCGTAFDVQDADLFPTLGDLHFGLNRVVREDGTFSDRTGTGLSNLDICLIRN